MAINSLTKETLGSRTGRRFSVPTIRPSLARLWLVRHPDGPFFGSVFGGDGVSSPRRSTGAHETWRPCCSQHRWVRAWIP